MNNKILAWVIIMTTLIAFGYDLFIEVKFFPNTENIVYGLVLFLIALFIISTKIENRKEKKE